MATKALRHEEYVYLDVNQTTDTIENQTPANQTIVIDDEEEPGVVKRFFIKFICRISNLFNKEKYNNCVDEYL